MSTARGKIVGAHYGCAPRDFAPSSHMIGGCEAGDTSILVIVRESCEAANLAKGPSVEQQVDARAAGQFAARPLADHAPIFRIGRETLVRDRLQRLHLGQHWSPGIIAVIPRRGGLTRVS